MRFILHCAAQYRRFSRLPDVDRLRRLLDMGLTPGTRVSVRKIAPMGDPIELFLRSYVLTIRKEEAANIAVEGVGETALPRAA